MDRERLMELIDEISSLIEELKSAMGGEEEEAEPPQMERQTDNDVMAGIPPRPRAPMPPML